jgi:hypothetical protein
MAKTDCRGTRRERLSPDAKRCDERRLVEVKLAVEGPGNAGKRETTRIQRRNASAAFVAGALQRTDQFDARERQGLAAGPAAKIECSRLVLPRFDIEPPASLHCIVDRVGAEHATEPELEWKLGCGRDVARGEADPRQLPARVRTLVAVVDRAALEVERAEEPVSRG